MDAVFFGISINQNRSFFQGVSVDQNRMIFQGVSVYQNRMIFRGVSVDDNPTVFRGLAVDNNPTVFKGLAIEEGELIPIIPEPGCPGETIESYLAVHQGQDGQFLCAYNADFTPFFVVRVTEKTSETLAELMLGSRLAAGTFRIAGPQCRDAFCLDGIEASVVVGCEFSNGKVIVRNGRNDDMIKVDGVTGTIQVGGRQTHGELRVNSPLGSVNGPSAEAALHFSADTGNLSLNGNGLDGGKLWLRKNGVSSILIDAERGEIEMANADFAEEFEVMDASGIPGVDTVRAGMVMVTGANGVLRPCMEAYDTRIAGVLSGAGSFKPAIVMDKQRYTGRLRSPVAMIGKAYCYVDASEAAIEPGDLLTTSPTPGHAMKALDPEQAFGATLGKALEAVPKGERKLIPVRVSLI